MSDKGYTSKVIGCEWMKMVFDPQTSPIANGRVCLLVVDGHASHFTSELLEYAQAHRIVVLCLPSQYHTLIAEWVSLSFAFNHCLLLSLSAMDVLGFKQFKDAYANVLQERA